ncbi:hypothetical protein BGZ95_007297 [Linnemannia exigua]|uniref:Uncharacterized protein n=1 Tax=Linnemannia exigua TaxID=604196 RepID=A0AAD4H0G0_9FUNG|nr:hypothetical protein BGZ95_007297 [Linnemannia exigua]
MYQVHPKPMRWPTMVDIIRNVCPRLTSLKIQQLPLQLRLDDSTTQDVFPTLTTLHLGDTCVTIKELIHLSLRFPNVESIRIRMKTSDCSLSSIDRSVVLPFKSVVFGAITSDDLVAVLPKLPWMSRLLIDQYDQQSSVATLAEAFKRLGARNQFKELQFPSRCLHRELLPDLTIFDGLDSSHVPLLRRIHIAFAAISGPLTPEMITTQIIDRLAPSLRTLEVSLQGPDAIMTKPWAKTLEQWFEDRYENRTEDDLLETHLTRSLWS